MNSDNNEYKLGWSNGVIEAAELVRKRADKLAEWMKSERITSPLREQLSLRAGELYEMATQIDLFQQKGITK